MASAYFWIPILSAAGIIAICNVIISLVKSYRRARHLAVFPSAPSDWFTGHRKHIKNHDGALLKFHVRCATEFKKCYVEWRSPTVGFLVLCHPDTVRVVQSSNAPKAPTYNFVKPFIGDGLIASNGAKWFRMRRLLTPAFYFEILKSYVGVFQESTNVLLEKWSSPVKGEVELFHHTSLMTLDSILKCALSYHSNCQTEEKKNSYISAVYDAVDEFFIRVMNPWLYPDFIYQMTAGARKFAKNCALIRNKAKETVEERRAALKDTDEQERIQKKKRLDFLDILLGARDEHGNGLSEEEIISEVMTFMFAGHDTTASSISWTLYNLARFPEHQQKCRQEIEEVFGEKEEFEWNDLNRLKYLQLCIKESNRLHSVVVSTSRVLDKPYEIDGKVVPEGTWVRTHMFALHRNPHVWKDPETFDPLRFTNENMKEMSPYAYIPFSAGPRNCIGQAFALAEIKTAIAMILRKFDLSVAPQNIVSNEDLQSHLILKARNGIVVNISPRSTP
ncbi:cytochrome P450 4F4-like [Porites lutea]|uniref:cytochrome P450 4F4-like n=1 Tax=Porites lutea TaxID=51062 RepID=UPI003CC599B4